MSNGSSDQGSHRYDIHWLRMAAREQEAGFQQRLIDAATTELRESIAIRRTRVVTYQLVLGADLCADCGSALPTCRCHRRGED